jgi:hypothetical protein
MSRLRRLVLSDRFFFFSCRVHRLRRNLNEAEFAGLAEVARERRKARRFLLTAWVFMPDSVSRRTRHYLSAFPADHFEGDGIDQGERDEAD